MKKAVIALATLIHLLPHPFGVSSVGAMALYAGAYGNRRTSWLVPLLPLALGLFITGLYEPIVMIFVFVGFSVATLAGRFVARNRSMKRFAVTAGAIAFFIISNLAVWWVYYPTTVAGLMQCYVNGLPYLGQAMLADAAYCFVLFGLHAVIDKRQPETVTA